jgi:hypothetical protein
LIRLPFNTGLTLSKRRKVPVFNKFGKNFLPHQLLRFLARARWLKVVEAENEKIVVELYGQRMLLLSSYFIMLANEWTSWEKYYLPSFSLKGKAILDVGAGCGETAFFYLLHGAKKVVAIEPESKAANCLRKNTLRNKWNVQILPEPFKKEHLGIPHDFMKMDIEGRESELLNVSYIRECIVEVHTDELRRRFEEKGFRRVYSSKEGYSLMSFTPRLQKKN